MSRAANTHGWWARHSRTSPRSLKRRWLAPRERGMGNFKIVMMKIQAMLIMRLVLCIKAKILVLKMMTQTLALNQETKSSRLRTSRQLRLETAASVFLDDTVLEVWWTGAGA